ncbi:TetR/AcrR family transcriptional regulator [Microbispora sp. NBRC 16548]|uniref:TetR/AcrR family transcriptional regulator n=1 Tax=Microbispora sp. NBRC 16548 TaxID=3030994 RepID=UPI00161CF819|nr:TetR/AcrR family transcriptional regulator [Microbispora sp. NBRC 16548]GLX11119.1 hypothetical protein Misp03_80450 [Microbispora sp. NBRC 16548]
MADTSSEAHEARGSSKRGRPRRGPDPERFQDIVDAAAKLMLDNGYSATSIQDIADAVGILKGSLYHYVRSKEDFLYRIIKDVYDAALEEIVPIAKSDRPALERLVAFVTAHVHFSIRHLTGFTIQIREFDRLSPERREEITAGGDVYVDALRGILQDGQEEGVVDRELDVRFTTVAILGELNYLTRWYSPTGPMAPDEMAARFAGLILGSVVSDKAVKAAGGLEKLRQDLLS